MNNKITCPICQRSMKDIGSKHIKTKHNLTIKQFKIQYPNQPLLCPELLKQKQNAANIRATKSYKTNSNATKKYIAKKLQIKIDIYNLNPKKCKNCNDTLPYTSSIKNSKRSYCKKPECQFIAHSIGGHAASKIPRIAWKTNPKWLQNSGTIKSKNQKKRLSSKGERKLLKLIKEKFIQYKWESGGHHYIGNNIYKSHDIYCKELKLIIEYDGIYHFKNIYGNLLQVQQKDNQLEKWCKENKWKLIRINEKTFNNVPNILNNIFQMIQNIPQLKTITKIYTIPEI